MRMTIRFNVFSGVSVLMTTVTNVIAFAIGTQSAYLSIKNFCLFTLFALFFGLLYELTLFFAFLCLEARKEEAQQACLCGLPKESTDNRQPFDINKVVSTYQVVSVLVAEAVKDRPPFDPILHHSIPSQSNTPPIASLPQTISRARLCLQSGHVIFICPSTLHNTLTIHKDPISLELTSVVLFVCQM